MRMCCYKSPAKIFVCQAEISSEILRLSEDFILFLTQLIDQCCCVKLDIVIGDQFTLLYITLHDCLMIDQTIGHIAFFLCLSMPADGTIGGIPAHTINCLSRLQINFRNSNTFGNQTVFRNNGRLPVDNNLGSC